VVKVDCLNGKLNLSNSELQCVLCKVVVAEVVEAKVEMEAINLLLSNMTIVFSVLIAEESLLNLLVRGICLIVRPQ
jgi:hypothetical protein